MGNQVDQLILGCILDATEHITQILVRVDVVGLAVCKDCQCPGKTGAAFGTTDEETMIMEDLISQMHYVNSIL